MRARSGDVRPKLTHRKALMNDNTTARHIADTVSAGQVGVVQGLLKPRVVQP